MGVCGESRGCGRSAFNFLIYSGIPDCPEDGGCEIECDSNKRHLRTQKGNKKMQKNADCKNVTFKNYWVKSLIMRPEIILEDNRIMCNHSW